MWIQSNSGLPDSTMMFDLAVAGTNVLLGSSMGIFLSSNNGSSWNFTTVFDEDIEDITAAGGFAYAIVVTGFFNTSGIYRSTNNGQSWSLILQSGNTYPNTLASRTSNVYLGDLLSGVSRSTNNGINWNSINIGTDIPGFAILPFSTSGLFAGSMTNTQQVYYSSNNGTNWMAINQGLASNTSVEALGSNSTYLFAGTNDKGVWKRALNEIVGITQISGLIPLKYNLYQNFPNPFNPETNIKFELPEIQHVKLVIYDMLGKEMNRLIDKELGAGSYSITFNADELSSGVYFYELKTDDFSMVRKMVVTK
jgi:hypothetical protein